GPGRRSGGPEIPGSNPGIPTSTREPAASVGAAAAFRPPASAPRGDRDRRRRLPGPAAAGRAHLVWLAASAPRAAPCRSDDASAEATGHGSDDGREGALARSPGGRDGDRAGRDADADRERR